MSKDIVVVELRVRKVVGVVGHDVGGVILLLRHSAPSLGQTDGQTDRYARGLARAHSKAHSHTSRTDRQTDRPQTTDARVVICAAV